MNLPLDQKALKASALAAASRGWRIFPLQPGGTLPAVTNWAERATCNPLRISRTWDHGPYNIGLLPCPSQLLVLELSPNPAADPPPARWQLPGVADGLDVLAVLAETAQARFPTELYTVRTPTGGWHLYFEHPPAPCPPASTGPDSALGWRVAVRSTPGYIPAAGTVTPDGAYTVVHAAAPQDWPSWLDTLAGRAGTCTRSHPATRP